MRRSYDKKIPSLLEAKEQVRFQYLKENHDRYNIKKACKALNVSRAGYYKYLNHKLSNRDIQNEVLSRKGNPYDNAVMESFYRTIKKELIQDAHYESPDQAQKEIFKYIELYYNTRRMRRNCYTTSCCSPPRQFWFVSSDNLLGTEEI